jgi:Ca2+-binding RTX toxin-like protein
MTRLPPLLALVAVLAVPAQALGATASVTDGQLRYVAASGEQNDGGIDINDAGDFRIWENNTSGATGVKLSAGAGCTVAKTEITCSKAGVTGVAVSFGDRDDSLNIGSLPVPITFSGGAGTDSAGYFSQQSVPLTISADGVADDGPGGHDNIGTDVESLFGGVFADRLLIGPGGGTLAGRGADDQLTGGAGNDLIQAAYVEDVGLDSGDFYPEGTDTVKCGGGQDFVLADSSDVIDPDCEAVGKDVKGGFEFMGSNGPDRISSPCGWDPGVIYGRGGNDLLIGGIFGARRIYGGAGNDRIQASDDYDSVDHLYGGSGNDRIRARDPGKGFRDVVDCGPGRDTAIVDRRDTVSGCERVLRSH